jgi:hypothetical protein
MSSGPFLAGGMDMVVYFWKTDENEFGDAWKWQALLGVGLGVIGGDSTMALAAVSHRSVHQGRDERVYGEELTNSAPFISQQSQ